MYQNSNNIITIVRGDNFSIDVSMNKGTKASPDYYMPGMFDKVYLGVMEPNQPFECATIKKIADYKSYNVSDKTVTITFSSTDTEYLLPGTYYYEAKLYLPQYEVVGESGESGEYKLLSYEIYTLMSKKKFIILD